MAADAALAVLERGDNFLFGTWHNVFLSIWRGTATIDALKRVSAISQKLDKRFTDGYCALAILSMSSLKMDAEMRAEASRLTDNPGPNLRAIAQVIQGTGVRAATTRMVAAGLNLVRKTKTPSKLFDDVPAAIRWLAPHIRSATPATPDQLMLEIDQAWPPA